MQRRAANQTPATGGAQRIDSRLCAADPDRTGWNLLSRHVTTRRGELFGETSQKWKSGNKSNAGDAIVSGVVKTDDVIWRNIRASRHIIDIERELRVIADWDFHQAHMGLSSFAASAAFGVCGYSSANARRQRVEHFFRCFSRLGDGSRVEENCDARVSRREFNYAGDGGALKLLKCAEDFVQRFLGCILELIAYTDDQRGISKGNNFHQVILSCW